MEPAPERRTRLRLRRLAIVVGSMLVALLVVFSVLLALVDSDAVIARIKDKALPKISAKIGREVTLETATARIFPTPQVTLGGLVIHGAKGEPPLVETAQAEVELKLWPLVRSFGKDVEVDVVTLVKPEVNLVRRADGTWNYEGLGAAQQGGPGEAPPPASEREVSLARLDIVGGTVRVIDRSTGKAEATVALEQLDVTLSNLGVGEALTMKGVAAFASRAQNLKAQLSTSPLITGALPEVRGEVTVEGAELPRLEGFLPAKMSELVNGGRLDGSLKVETQAGRYAIEGEGRANALQLRGQPAHGGFKLRTSVDPDAIAATVVHFEQITLRGPGLELGGTARATMEPKRVQFDLAGPLLDLNQLLGVLPSAPDEQDAMGAPAEVNRSALLPANVRAKMEEVDVRGSLQVDRVVNGKLALEKLDAQAVLKKGVLTLERAQGQLFGGRIDASGTTANLIAALPKWTLKARLEQVDLQAAMNTVSGSAPMHGHLDASLNVSGEGADWAKIREGLDGSGALAIREGALTTTDLGAKIARVVAQGLQKAGKRAAADKVARAAGTTELRDLTGSFRIRDGWMVLNEPMAFTSKFGGGRVDGRVGLDLALELQGDVVLSQQFLSSTLGPIGVSPQGPLSVPLKIGGTLKAPRVSGLSAGAIASEVAKGAAQGTARKLENEVKTQARRRAGDFLKRLGGGR